MKPDDTPTADRHLKVTPIDLRQTKFKTSMRGFDRDEVTAFLVAVADDYEAAPRDKDRLRHELIRLDAALNQHRELEGSLKSTLVSAQKVADDMRETANLEGARIVRDAESRADLLTQKAQVRLEDMQREIDSLKFKRREADTTLETTISTLHNTLEFVRAQDEREDKVVAHRPRVEIAPRPA